jgi:hypothetical protein
MADFKRMGKKVEVMHLQDVPTILSPPGSGFLISKNFNSKHLAQRNWSFLDFEFLTFGISGFCNFWLLEYLDFEFQAF